MVSRLWDFEIKLDKKLKPLDKEEELCIGRLKEDHPDRIRLVTHNMGFFLQTGMKVVNRFGFLLPDPNSYYDKILDYAIYSSKIYKSSYNAKFITFTVRGLIWRCQDEIRSQMNCSTVISTPRNCTKKIKSTYLEDLKINHGDERKEDDIYWPKELRNLNSPDKILLEDDMKTKVRKVILECQEITQREKDIVLNIFQLYEDRENKTPKQLCLIYKISSTRISMLKIKTLNKLKKNSLLKALK